MTTEIQMANHGGLVKLFGATIHVAPRPPPSTAAAAACKAEHRAAAALQVLHNDKKPKTDDDDSRTTENQQQQPLPNRSKEQSGSPADDREVEAVEEQDSDHKRCAESDEEKKKQGEKDSLTKKKPDKLLPCPRCDSMDTKFCYFNNYNVNQPRHFCRVCQRYWTAGGAVRPNMPVGAGKRKKPSRSAGAGASARCQLDGDVVVVLDSVGSDADHHAVTTVSPRDGGEILSFGDGMGSPSSNFSPVKLRQLSTGEQAIPRVESCHPVVAPQIAWPITGVANPPPQLYFYGGNQGPPAAAAVCGIAATAGGFAPSPQPVHLCWTSTPTAAAGWQVFSLVPWAPQMASYNPTPAPSRPIPAPLAVRKHSHSQSQSHSHSHDTDRLSFGSSGVEDSLSRQSSSSLEISPRAKVAAKKRSFAIREEEEEEVGAFGSYQLRTDMSDRRTEVASKVLQSNPAAMLRSLSFQETV